MPKKSALCSSLPKRTEQKRAVVSSQQTYKGRFAPSPSGPLHQGSLIAALASYLDAKANNGFWYVRMEDLDPPRESPEAADQILRTLETLHLFWDADVLYQSQRHTAYQESLNILENLNLTFNCTCSRQHINQIGGAHLGRCIAKPNEPFAVRCLCDSAVIQFTDLFQGKQKQDLAKLSGDFVIKRKDGFYAYQLAVVVDDAFQEITHVIRGIDLLSSTGKQIYLQRALNIAEPSYGHIPVIVNEFDQKLSKQHFASPLNLSKPQALLYNALQHLRQKPDPDLLNGSLDDLINWAITHWNPSTISHLQQLPMFEEPL